MDIILGLVIIMLVLLVLFQHHRYKQQQANLLYACTKLQAITNQHTDEKLLLHTEDIHLKTLLNEINRLLEQNQKTVASYYQMEISIRKMLSNISHDLRTSLTVVLGYIEVILNDPTLTRSQVDVLLAKVHDKTIEVLSLMKKFFDLVKLESGDHDIEISKIDVSEICKANILSFYDILTAQDIEVVIDIPDDKHYMAYGNEEELNRILNNLLSNAVQYGSEGRVLGLTITKRLVEKMGGEISFVSKPYEKTVFTVMLKRYTT